MTVESLRPWTALGDSKRRAEFTREHNRRLLEWFDADGHFRHPGTPPNSRERLWNCFSLMKGDARCVRLANRIVMRTPVDSNHFLPIAAAELALRFPRRLTATARRRLIEAVRRHYVNTLEWRFGAEGMHNFVCMTTFFLLAAPHLLPRYTLEHEFASIPEVYSTERMREIGRNALRLLAYEWERRPISNEFNSPTYSPIAVMAVAKIVELIPDPEVREMALRIEARHWRELLTFHHPRLNLPCGPHSRAYRVDVLGQVSLMRVLMAHVGLSADRSVAAMLDGGDPDVLLHHDNDMPFNWANAAWLLSTAYHVPVEPMAQWRRRRFPHRLRETCAWRSSGRIDPAKETLLSVQGDVLPAGEADVIQVQRADWALGWISYRTYGHSLPIHLHYALHPDPGSMRDVRSVLCGVMFGDRPEEWTKDQRGDPVESSNFNHSGHLRVRERGSGLRFEGRPLEGLAPLPTEEISINAFLPTHFAPVTAMALNGRSFTGCPIEICAEKAVWEVNDHGFRFRIEYRFERPTSVRLFRWARFIRFAGFLYDGPRRAVARPARARMTVRGSLFAERPRTGSLGGDGVRAYYAGH